MRGLIRGTVLLSVLLLAACAGRQPDTVKPASVEALWQQHQQTVGSIKLWDLRGRMAFFSGENNGSVKMHWLRDGDIFHIRLNAPWGQGGADIRGDSQQVVMRTAKGEVLQAQSVESLWSHYFGWQLPGLEYWMLGLPDPQLPIQEQQWNADGQLIYLRQSDISVEFQQYTPLDKKTRLPSRLLLHSKRHDFKVRIIISQWLA